MKNPFKKKKKKIWIVIWVSIKSTGLFLVLSPPPSPPHTPPPSPIPPLQKCWSQYVGNVLSSPADRQNKTKQCAPEHNLLGKGNKFDWNGGRHGKNHDCTPAVFQSCGKMSVRLSSSQINALTIKTKKKKKKEEKLSAWEQWGFSLLIDPFCV